MVKLVPKVQMAQLALLVKEVNKVLLAPMDSRDFLALQVPLVKVANRVTRVYLEKVEHQVLLVQEVNVVSQVNVDLLVLKVSKVLVVFLELLVLMVRRVQVVQLVPTVLKVHPVCKVCLAREEHLAFLDPRETGVMLARKAQKVLPEKMVEGV